MPEILDVHDILALKMSHASTLIMNDRQKPQNFQNKLNTQQRCVNFVNHLDRIRVLATLCPVKSKGAEGRLVNDKRFIRELEEMLVKDIRNACARNTNPRAKPKALDTKSDLIYKRVFGDFL